VNKEIKLTKPVGQCWNRWPQRGSS